jgi:excisionase family DNA binding protein
MALEEANPLDSVSCRLLTVNELCLAFGVSRDWVYKHANTSGSDHLPCVRLGRLVRFKHSEVSRYINARQKGLPGASLAATDGIARARERRKMARKRFQKGYVRLRKTKKHPYWEGFYWEDLRMQDGSIARKQRAVNLGRLEDVPSKKLAEHKLADNLAEVNHPDAQPRSVSTLGDFVESRYRKLILPLRKRTTRHGYEVILNHHILPEFKDRQVAEIIHEDVQAFVNRKLESGAAWNTVKNIVSVFSAVYATAVKYGYVRSNPVRLVEMPSEPVRFQPELPTDEDLQKFQNALQEPYRTMVWLGCATGVRVSELLGLRWKSIDWKHQCLWIREAVHDGEIDSPKTHRSCRPIRLAKAELERLKKFQARNPRANENGWVFLNTRGTGPFRADNLLEHVLRPTAEDLGIPRITWHLLRHWHSTVLHDEGVPIKVAQERLGHSRAETTMKHYVHLSQQADADAANAVSRRLRRVQRKAKTGNSVSRFVSRNDVLAVSGS